MYAGTPFVARERWVQEKLEDDETISQWLTAKRGHKVRVVVPQKGQKERLVELAQKNAAMVLAQDKEKIKREELKTIGDKNEIGVWHGRKGVRRIAASDTHTNS